MPAVAEIKTDALAEVLRDTLGEERDHLEAISEALNGVLAALERLWPGARVTTDDGVQVIDDSFGDIEAETGLPAQTAYSVVVLGRILELFARAKHQGDDTTPIQLPEAQTVHDLLSAGNDLIHTKGLKKPHAEAPLVKAKTDLGDLEDVLGPAPSAERMAEVRRAEQRLHREQLERALAGALTREEAAERLGITTQAVSTRRKHGTMTAIEHGGACGSPLGSSAMTGRCPAWPR